MIIVLKFRILQKITITPYVYVFDNNWQNNLFVQWSCDTSYQVKFASWDSLYMAAHLGGAANKAVDRPG